MISLKSLSLNLSEENYHALPAWSYSLIARYAKDGFSSIATLHDPVASTPSMEFGSLFDYLLTRSGNEAPRYVVSDTSVPDAEKAVLDRLSVSTATRFDKIPVSEVIDAANETKYYQRWKDDTRYEHIAQYKSYFDNKARGLKSVSIKDMSDAREMVGAFRNDEYLSTLFGPDTKDIEHIYQAQFLITRENEFGDSVDIKIMPDLIVVNHKEKTIQIVDVKTCSMPAYNFADNFIKFRYDIQASLYSDVMREVSNRIPQYAEYEILPFLFTAISRTDKVPVVYSYDPYDITQVDGLAFKDYHYKNYKQLLDEIIIYENTKAVVPDGIKLNSPNSIIDILNNR